MPVTCSFIDGDVVDSAQHYDNVDPSTSRAIDAVARGGEPEVDRAVASARRAFTSWRKVAAEERSIVLGHVADAIDGQRERLAVLESEDTGKPLAQARTDAAVAVRYFRFYAHAIDSYYGRAIPLAEHLLAYTRREPLGVTGHIVACQVYVNTYGAGGGVELPFGGFKKIRLRPRKGF